MATTKIELTIEQKDLFTMGSVLHDEPNRYYYFPFWIKEDTETGELWLLDWKELPEELKNKLNEMRNEG